MTSRLKNTMPRYQYLLLTTALVTCTSYHAAHAQEAWSQFNTEHGNITIDTSTINNTLINQQGGLYIGNSNNLDINANQSVTIGQDDSQSLFVAKSRNGSDPTRILGSLSTRTKNSDGSFSGATGGSVMILDSNGVFFGKDAVIDSHGIVASTGQIDNDQLIDVVNNKSGRVSLSDLGEGAVINEGTISVSDGGLAAFVAPTVTNNGTITARAGRVELGAANTLTTVDLYGDGLIEIVVNDKNTAALIANNKGTIDAAGGVIHITTGAAEKIVNAVINMDGVTQASSITQKGGKIILGGANTGKVTVSGTVAADGQTGGGTVDVKAKGVDIKETAVVSADGIADGDGGSVIFIGENSAILSGRARARGGKNSGNGGFIELSTDGVFDISGGVDTSAENGTTGRFLIDPRDLEILIGTRPNLFASGLYESDIEFLSLLTDIELEARRNITVSAGKTGTSDGVITIAGGRNLYIHTSNSPYTYLSLSPFGIVRETNNAGSIDLTANATYGKNLEFKTSGNGTITIAGATDNNQSSDIVLSKLTTDKGAINVTTKNGKIDWNGNVTTNGGAVNGTSTKQQTVNAQIATNGGAVNLTGNNTTANSGLVVTSNGSIKTKNGKITLKGQTGNLDINGEVNADTNGDIDLSGNAVQLNGTSVVTGDDTNIVAGSLTQDVTSTLTGDVLTGQIQNSASLLGTNNNMTTIGAFATGLNAMSTGGFAYNDVNGFAVDGDVNTDGGDISLVGHGDSWAAGKNVELNAGKTISSQGGKIVLANDGAASTLINGDINSGTGDTELRGHFVNLNGNSVVTADNLNIASSDANQELTSKIIAGSLTAQIQNTGSLLGTNNDVQTIGTVTTGIGNWTTGGFAYNDVNGFAVDGDVSTDGGDITLTANSDGLEPFRNIVVRTTGSIASTGGNITIDTKGGDLRLNGMASIDAGAGDVSLLTSDLELNNRSVVSGDEITLTSASVTQNANSKILANTLTGQVQTTTSLLGTNNDINTLGAFATGLDMASAGGFAYNDVNDVAIDGDISSDGGAITIKGAGVTLNTGKTVSSQNGNITLDGKTATLAINGSVTAGTGDIELSGNAVQLNANSSVTGDDTNIVAGSVTQDATSTLTGDELTGQIQGSASLTSANNDFATLANVSTGLSSNSRGGFAFVDKNGLDVTGIVSSDNSGVNDDALIDIEAKDGELTFTSTSGVQTNGGGFNATSNEVINIDNGAEINLVSGSAFIDTPTVNLDDDINTFGFVSGTASIVNVLSDAAEIQDGVDVAANGATVDVAPGLYEGDVYVGKSSLTINGAQAGVDARDRNNVKESQVVAGRYGFNVDSDNVTIDGFNIISNSKEQDLPIEAIFDLAFAEEGTTDGIVVNNANAVILQNNIISGLAGDGVTSNSNRLKKVIFDSEDGVFAQIGDNRSTGLLIQNNLISGNGGNGVSIEQSSGAGIINNLITDNVDNGVLITSSNDTSVTNNDLTGNGTGVEIVGIETQEVINDSAGFDIPEIFLERPIAFPLFNQDTTSDGTEIISNLISDSDVGIQTSGSAVGSVLLADNALEDNTTGMLFQGGDIDISELTAPNSISGGTTGIRFDATEAANLLSLVNNTLGTTIFTGQSGNYVELANGALFNPGTPTIIDGLSANFDGIIPANAVLGAGLLTATERLAIEAKLIDFDDDALQGQILVGLGLNVNEEDLFSLSLFSLQPQTGNVRVTVLGLPRVSLTSVANLASISPAAGAGQFASVNDLANIEPAAGGTNNQTAEDLNNIEPAAGGSEGCWASQDTTNYSNGAVNYSFGSDVNSAISDESCAAQ